MLRCVLKKLAGVLENNHYQSDIIKLQRLAFLVLSHRFGHFEA